MATILEKEMLMNLCANGLEELNRLNPSNGDDKKRKLLAIYDELRVADSHDIDLIDTLEKLALILHTSPEELRLKAKTSLTEKLNPHTGSVSYDFEEPFK